MLVAIVVAVLTASVVGFLAWISPRGFDITDEGFYLLEAQFPGDVVNAASKGYLTTAILFRMTSRNIVAFRVAGLVLTVASAFVLYVGVDRFWQSMVRDMPVTRSQRIAESGLVVLGTLTMYQWFLPTPGYNMVNLWACSGWAGSLLLGLSRLRSGPRTWSTFSAMVVAGFCLTMAFLTKFPSGLALLGLTGFCLVIWRGKPSSGVRTAAAIAVGVGIGLCFFYVAAATFAPTAELANFRHYFAANASFTGESASKRLLRNFREIYVHIFRPASTEFWILDALLFVSMTAVGLRSRIAGTQPRGHEWGIVLSLALAGWLSYQRGYWPYYAPGISDFGRIYFSWLVLLMVAVATSAPLHWAHVRRCGWSHARAALTAAAILFALPFVGAIGTTNPININVGLCLAGWFALIVFILRGLARLERQPLIVGVGATVLAALLAFQVISGPLRWPHRLNSGVLHQTQPTNLGSPSTRLFLDAPTSLFFHELRLVAARCGLSAGDDVLAFFDMPGIVFALGGRSPGLLWFTHGYPGSRARNEQGLRDAGVRRVSQAYLLETHQSRPWLGTLNDFGIVFPQNYVLCGELKIPYTWLNEHVRLWRPRTWREGVGDAPTPAEVVDSRRAVR